MAASVVQRASSLTPVAVRPAAEDTIQQLQSVVRVVNISTIISGNDQRRGRDHEGNPTRRSQLFSSISNTAATPMSRIQLSEDKIQEDAADGAKGTGKKDHVMHHVTNRPYEDPAGKRPPALRWAGSAPQQMLAPQNVGGEPSGPSAR